MLAESVQSETFSFKLQFIRIEKTCTFKVLFPSHLLHTVHQCPRLPRITNRSQASCPNATIAWLYGLEQII